VFAGDLKRLVLRIVAPITIQAGRARRVPPLLRTTAARARSQIMY
jgi:hypothetical protein